MMIKLLNNKIEKKIHVKNFKLTKKSTKELTNLFFSFYNWRETTKIKVKTDELLKEIEIV